MKLLLKPKEIISKNLILKHKENIPLSFGNDESDNEKSYHSVSLASVISDTKLKDQVTIHTSNKNSIYFK